MSELADDGIPVAVSLRFLKLSRQPDYRLRKQQVTESELIESHRANPSSTPAVTISSSGIAPSLAKPQQRAR